MRRWLLAWALTFSLTPLAASALTLEEAVAMALRNDPRLRALEEERDAYRLERRAAGRLLAENPDLEIAAGLAHDTATGADGFEWSVGLSQELELGGQQGARRAALDAALQRVEARWVMRRRDLALEARNQFVRVLAARERERLAAEAVHLAEQAAEAAEGRLAKGTISRIDRNAALVESALARRELAEAMARAAEEQAALRRLLGLSPDEPLEIEGSFPLVFAAVDAVPRRRPELEEARRRQEEAKALSVLAEADALPELQLGARVEREDRTNKYFAVIGFEFPFFSRNEEDRAEALREQAEARAALVEVEREVAAEQEAARARWEVARTAAAVFEGLAVEALRENVELATAAYRDGELRFLEYLEVRRQTLEGWRAWVDTQEELALAHAAWVRAMGLPLE